MKAIKLLLYFLLMATPLSAIEPGRYLISCEEVTSSGKGPFRGYLLTVPIDGDPVLEVAGSELNAPPSAHTESVRIIQVENSKNILIVAVFTESHAGPGGVAAAIASHSISLAFDESGDGGGAEVSIGRPHGAGPLAEQHYLEAIIAKLPNAEQAGAGQPATRSESKSEGNQNPNPETKGRSR